MAPEEKHTGFATECVRLAELTDNQEIRDHLQALALHRVAEAVTEKDNHANVTELPWRAQRSRRLRGSPRPPPPP
jgi:hypothetical protein